MKRGSIRSFVVAAVATLEFLSACASGSKKAKGTAMPEPAVWRGVHVMCPPPGEFPILKRAIQDVLAPLGLNTLVLEVDYNFQFASHPEITTGRAISKEQARDFSSFCQARGIRVIPLMNCLGHQSWKEPPGALLRAHPEFEEIPDVPTDSKDFYCRSWCPLHPDVNEFAFDLMDEIIEGFGADAIHVGLDEVFILASEKCPRCKGKDKAELFAKAVNDYHRHLVKKRGVTMLMWGDRLLDGEETGYGMWEASMNGTAPAIDLIPKDIVICDWHYTKRDAYPSIPLFQEKGFRVRAAGWRDMEGTIALMDYAQAHDTGGMLGHLCTFWGSGTRLSKALLGEAGSGDARDPSGRVAEVVRYSMKRLRD